MTTEQVCAVQEALAAPFPAECIGWRPGPASFDKTKCIAMPYIDARDVQDRLDAVLGCAGWMTEFREVSNGCVVCVLSCNIGGVWIGKSDVGAPSEQPDKADQLKSAFSDSLKRAAVAWGIGRYLYQLPTMWAPFDAQRKRITQEPKLPAHALPGHQQNKAAAIQGEVREPARQPSITPERQQLLRDTEGLANSLERMPAILAAHSKALRSTITSLGQLTDAQLRNIKDRLEAEVNAMQTNTDDMQEVAL